MLIPLYVSRVSCHVSHVICHLSHVTCYVSHVIFCIFSNFYQLFIPFPCGFCLRPLTGPQVTWSDPGLSLVDLPPPGFERDEDNVSFCWDNKGPGSIVPIPITLYYHGGGLLPLSRSKENFSTGTICHVLVWKWLWDKGLDHGGIWRATIGTKELCLRLNYVDPRPLPC